ncbi:MAG: type II toxin-antitoxin system Phd/YefM family antitoxin [Leptospiraceae bacterium]|jgi:antitoxin Phd|nr:type II toxin-antitoxin system Phd/YefM family antitoxin [Leptospiraceae bacterium]MBK7054412.1 type II toxin-antitoxin system Phd/YefM family antitoxin [Leptospiraceae bacterium]MBK9498780.1 type II toxin-antitoxin system Phd/YefM family antitoxin [Leptospiraceae bacterium]MBL0262651.1 type II toxin-antitoxin system Phd/YefM family antitoxin [Leptospiraceae bacterium]
MSIAQAWQLQDAKSKFSELVESAISKGPQFVTKRGVKSVVVISIDEFNRLKKPKEDLLSFFNSAPRIDLVIERKKDFDRDISL